ncbi:TetR/AcrR family transcriptional regulator [Halobacterium litoreum]|uniref:TetR/AcrR family transcriptional regulator n=1 Tax=Halobacterium litoreum TaxID=2039234 RepID=A0ABD5ND69_9EURY|nr:TetR/AcrR family transcriptional regulator [Halobacterium litoreum]UHH13863.1 TetR/AcrR family transcriptional regulator [Halobacterium litoreum]
MAGFSDGERERIRAALLDAGSELFARYGLDKTTVGELADAAGIATGSFYTFFDSKERLYYEVLMERAEDAFARMTAAVEAADGPESGTRAFLREAIAIVEEDPLIRNLVYGNERERLLRAISDEEIEATKERKVALLAPYVERWQDEGVVRSGDPETLALAVQSAGFVVAHRDEFGSEEEYEAVRDALVDLVAAGLASP